jgi:tRNA pseudouridine55 synthase
MITEGFLVVDKPPGVTSHDVVAVVRAVTGLKKVGHTGTLDPFATGVLPLALGSATRLIQYLNEDAKVYDAHVLLGRSTDTGDPTGQVIAEADVPPLDRATVERVLATFLGTRMQTPPRYSAVKVAGKPLYAYARAGKEMKVEARPVRIDGMELLELDPPRLRVLIRCGRGTYARVLAEEIGVALGTVGHLEELRRTGSGPFLIENAVSFSRISEIVAGDPAWDRVLRPARGEERVAWRPRDAVFQGLQPFLTTAREALAHLPIVVLSERDARRFLQTGAVPPPPRPDATHWVLLDGETVVGVATAGKPTAEPITEPRR